MCNYCAQCAGLRCTVSVYHIYVTNVCAGLRCTVSVYFMYVHVRVTNVQVPGARYLCGWPLYL